MRCSKESFKIYCYKEFFLIKICKIRSEKEIFKENKRKIYKNYNWRITILKKWK